MSNRVYDRLDKMESEGKKALKKKDVPKGEEVEEYEMATFEDLKEIGKESAYMDSLEDEKIFSGKYKDKIWEVWQRKNGWYDTVIKDERGKFEYGSTCKTPHEYIKWFADHDINIYEKENLADSFMNEVESALKMAKNLNNVMKEGYAEAPPKKQFAVGDDVIVEVGEYNRGEGEHSYETVELPTDEKGTIVDKGNIGGGASPTFWVYHVKLQNGVIILVPPDRVILSNMGKKSDVNGESIADQVVEWLNNFTPENEAKFQNLIEEGRLQGIDQPQIYDEEFFIVDGEVITSVGSNSNGLDEKKLEVSGRILTKEELYNHWSREEPLEYNGIKYRVGKMSYGDYFLEPGPLRGETEGFNEGTLWPMKIPGGNDYIVEFEISGSKVKSMKHRPRDVYLPGNAHLIASWETRGGRYFFDLYQIGDSFTYNSPRGLGDLGMVGKDEAVGKMSEKIKSAKETDGITYRRVL